MLTQTDRKRFYKALLERNSEYDGVFYVGVKSTGIFCHASCPAKKPKYENCEFFTTAKQALLASYRPCQRCKPLCPPHQVPKSIERLVAAVEENPQKRWKTQDFRELGVDESTARRQFKKRFGMTFVEYARSRRIGLAMRDIKSGKAVIDAQMTAGYDSASGFRDAFSKIMGDVPKRTPLKVLWASWIDTPLGPMLSMSDDDYLYLLEFVDRRGLEREVERLRQRLKVAILPGETKILRQLTQELAAYFRGECFVFETLCNPVGSDFQKQVWNALKAIAPGQTRSYSEIASAIKNVNSFRAVANANGANQLAIIYPCHRVIQACGKLGGYGGGVSRKVWLLQHEKMHAQRTF